MYTEALVEKLAFGAMYYPNVLTASTTVNSGSADFSKIKRGVFRAITGPFGGTSPTLSAALQLQVSPDNATWYAATANNTSATMTTASNQQALEIRGDQLAQQSAQDGRQYRYARLQAVCTIGGTSPTIPLTLDVLQGESMQGPAAQFNDPSVLPPLQAVSP